MNMGRKSSYTAALCVLFVLLLSYSFYKLSESPPTWFDEGIFIQVAQSLSLRGTQAIQTAPGVFLGTGHVTGGYPFLVPVALSLKLFGDTTWAARVPMAIFIVLCVVVAFLLMYKLSQPRDALLSLALLSTFPLLFGNGKNVLGEVPGMFYTLLALYFLWQIEWHAYRGATWYMLAGLSLGLAAATKPVFFLLPIATGLVFLMRVRSIPLRWKEIGLATLACCAPLVLWAYMQFGGGDVASSILFHYVNPYAESSLMHTALQNAWRFFTEATPLYCGGLIFIWLLAVVVRLYRKATISNAELVAFTFALLIMLAYLRTAGWYRYFFEAMLLALIFLPHSLRVIAERLEGYAPRLRLARFLPVPLLLFAAIQLYQLNFSSWVADHYNSTQSQVLENYFVSYTPQGSVFVYNAPEIVPFLRTEDYYQYFDIEPTGALAYGKENLSLLAQKMPVEVIITPSMYEEHAELFQRYKQHDTVGSYLILERR